MMLAKPVKPMLTLVVAMGFLSACTHTALPTQPVINYPAQFATGVAADESMDPQWWQAFNAPALNQLLDMADQQSPDLLITRERVRQAEYQLNIANASWFPSLDLSASSGRRRSEAPDGVVSRTESSSLDVRISYEVDLWGGVAAERRAARASYNATRYDQDAAQLSLRAAIASGWFQWLALRERIDTAQKNIDIAQRIMRVVDARYRNGSASAADVAQQKTNLLSQQASLLPLQLQARQASAALAILVGKTPQEFVLAEEPISAMTVPEITPGTPAQLILRRPDLAASEASLLAADANLVAARAALFPSLNLSAGIGRSASELFSLNPATQASNWSLSLAQTLFSGGRLLNQKGYSEARRAELLLQYHKAILTALQEVDIALASADNTRQQEEQQTEITAQAERSLRLTEARYREGSDDLLSLLSAQRTLFQAQDALVQQHQARLTAAVDVYKALGGGWQLATGE
ncbi:efflux transporter outer membrane subunit [Cellvibrio japonicus]|uniref:Efflux transporter, outer membrane factor (OMF) lipoprotein, NodT family n=1 Tax=Cellvibrio japonicus (strain Ueda107) TaxID=498211 RepID=B3PL18_CELJU|nr:efflux transporter outer membrane subunit [Cellvibrio japonicus]ACE85479.1 efflux transporter, outer membrane factor (OMF) lipoprotein, NodT family [Cellvibrio japonicus Ueda107]